MECEEFTDLILDIDTMLLQIENDMQMKNVARALIRIKQTRGLIANAQTTEDDMEVLDLIK